MTPLRATADLFAPLPDLNTHVLAGLDLLARSPALWPVGTDRWADVLATVKGFEQAHGRPARARGWSDLSLYGLHRTAPYANLAGMGAAFFVARSGHRVAGIDGDGILLISPNGARLRIYRVEPDECAVAVWALCRAVIGKQC
jgi:hypothetical protein